MNHPVYSKDPTPGEIREALGNPEKMTPQELDAMPRIIERFRNEGLLKFPNSEMHRRAVSHKAKA